MTNRAESSDRFRIGARGGVRRAALALAAMLGLGDASAPAQNEPAPARVEPGAQGQVEIDTLPPPLRLGIRTAVIQQRLSVVPTLVLVPDERSYLEAIAAWSTGEQGARRFPVLIDRGTYSDQQRIARFVRAFEPESVVRWTAPEGASPSDRGARERAIQHAVNRAWGAEGQTEEALRARWQVFKFTPPGVVVSWADDPAWTAAAALAAGRGQPIAWIEPRHGGPGSLITLDELRAWSKQIEGALKASGYSYAELGDDIDALTICSAAPVKVMLPGRDKRQFLATTDLLGRHENASRYAWAGHIEGDAAQAAYMAMCSLFLTRPGSAWLFDGYDINRPWVAFDASEAGEKLKAAGLRVEVDDAPSGGSLTMWRKRAAGASALGFGVDASLICVNTSGNADFFELKPGLGKPTDIPALRTPALVHFVHSWSAYNPRDRNTIAHAWIERGAFAYVGSVHEPFLSAFVPTPIFVQRVAAGLPWGAAVRIDGGEVWKLGVLGDPLMTAHPRPARVAEKPALPGAIDLAGELPEMLKSKRFLPVLRTMARLGRDKDAARLVAALLRERPGDVTPELAGVGCAPVFFSGDLTTLLALAPKIVPDAALPADPAADAPMLSEVRAMVWHAVWASRQTLGKEAVTLLTRCLRRESLVEDTRDVLSLLRVHRTPGLSPRDVVIRAQRMTTDRALSDALDKLDDQ